MMHGNYYPESNNVYFVVVVQQFPWQTYQATYFCIQEFTINYLHIKELIVGTQPDHHVKVVLLLFPLAVRESCNHCYY